MKILTMKKRLKRQVRVNNFNAKMQRSKDAKELHRNKTTKLTGYTG